MPLRTRPEVDERAHVHGTAFVAAGGGRTLLLVNDHPSEEVAVELALPAAWAGLPARCSRVSAGCFASPFAPATGPAVGGRIAVAVPAMSLLAWHDVELR
jgi:hypothetical protein